MKLKMLPSKASQLIAIAILGFAVTSARASEIRVEINGNAVAFDGEGPKMINDRVFVPLRGVFERLGASVEWNESSQTITCEKQAKKIWLRIGDRDAMVDNKSVRLDDPAMLYRGTTMVPLRFISESLGADVHWDEAMQAVHITTMGSDLTGQNNTGSMREVSFESGTVVPVMLDNDLSSDNSKEGDKFTATIGTSDSRMYAGLPQGSMVLGHVSMAKPKNGKDPGVLALDFDSIVTPGGSKYAIQGSLIGLDNKSVEYKNDRILAKNTKSDNDHKSVWIGAGAGAVLAVVTKGNILTDTVVGAALGYLYDTLGVGGTKANDVRLNKGSTFGVKLDREFIAKIGQ